MIRRVVQTSLRLWCVPTERGIAFAPVLDELDLGLHEVMCPKAVPVESALEHMVKGWRAVEWVPPDELAERYPEKPTGRRDGMSAGPHLDRVLKGVYKPRFVERYRTSSGDGSNG